MVIERAIEEVTERSEVPATDTGAAIQTERQKLAEEAAEFVMRHVIERGATFFDG